MKDLLEYATVILLTIGYADIEGKREGMYYWMKSLSGLIDNDYKEHNLFTWQRVIVVGLTHIIFWYTLDSASLALISLVCLWSMFPMIHDTSYYSERERLVPGTYPNGFNNQTVKSTSKLDNIKNLSTPTTRFILFMIGATGLVVNIIYMIHKLK